MEYDCSGDHPHAVSLVLKSTGRQYISGPGREFRFRAGDVQLFSENAHVFDVRIHTVSGGGAGADIYCDTGIAGLTVVIRYSIYPDGDGFQKDLKIVSSDSPVRLERIMIHETGAAPAAWCDCDFYSGHEFYPEQVNFVRDGDGELLTCYDPVSRHGWMMASGVPGVLRYMMVYPQWNNVSAGYSMGAAACARYLEPGEEFITAPVFFSLFSGAVGDPDSCRGMNTLIRYALAPDKFGDSVMYCSWIPFNTAIDEAIITAQAAAASELGFGHFVLDDGWFVPESDWCVDTAKFPGGLENISDFVHRRNMKFGLWFDIGTAYGIKSPDARCRMPDSSGRAKKQGKYDLCCPGSTHRDMVTEQLINLAERYQVDYFKLDFSTISSPYANIEYGCGARDHAYHRDWNDSFIAAYDSLQYIRQTLSQHFPELLIDFSFETFGINKPSLAGLLYSDIQHVSNLNADKPQFQHIRRLRKNFTRWTGVLPPERILHGLISLHDADAFECLLTGFCGAPLYSGNLTQLDRELRDRMREAISRYRAVVRHEPLTSFEIMADGSAFDGFIRRGGSGHGLACGFNRSDKPQTTEYGIVPAGSCKLFTF